MITHGNLTHYVQAMGSSIGITPDDVYLHTATIAFSSSVRQLFLPLAHGAKVDIATTDEIRQPVDLFTRVKQQKVTVIDIVPSYWRNAMSVLMALSADTRRELLDNDLRLVLTASEPLQSDLPGKWRRDLDHRAAIINMFGQTETTGIVALFPIAENYDAGNGIIPIGKPLPRTQVYLLDDRLQPVADGDAGELYVGGPGVGRGYWNRSELTLERFIPDQFNVDRGDNLYRTGDLARRGPDGNLRFLGRVDDQIKMRGVRIEPGEIEAALGKHDGIKEIAVAAKENDANDKLLVAYFVPSDERTPSTKELRQFLKSRLPEYLIPSAFVELQALPRTASGKVDRRALPMTQTSRSKLDYVYASALGAVEIQLVKMWQSLLGVSHIGVDDDFFDLGGHSYLAMRMFAQTVTAFGKALPIAAFFQTPTIRQLAKLVGGGAESKVSSSTVALQPNGTRPPLFWLHGDTKDAAVLLPTYLGKEQPVYQLQQVYEHGMPVAYKTVDSLATHYLGELRKVQPKGSYYLGGYCFGGLVALELSQRLKSQGDEVALLFLLAPPALNNLTSAAGKGALFGKLVGACETLQAECSRHLNRAESLSPYAMAEYFSSRIYGKIKNCLVGFRDYFVKLIREISAEIFVSIKRPIPTSLRLAYILRVYRRAAQGYQAQPFTGKIVLFKAQEDSYDAAGWSAVATGGLEFHEVPGNHESVVRDNNIQFWAERLKDHLLKAQAVESSTHFSNGR
jgi:aspartate racemase